MKSQPKYCSKCQTITQHDWFKEPDSEDLLELRLVCAICGRSYNMPKPSKRDQVLNKIFNQLLLRAKLWTRCSPTKPEGTSARYIEIKQAMLVFEEAIEKSVVTKE